ncbi:leucine carboxyl methyltransferase 1 [Lindgomyces ingoldianus]|uniref:Leucine carboxyl methyltransferase 1 n=1 Tax=Lindgomyces ingoldianus TaxID=673940 RepID=A0ACB6RFI6_9PLEO|nr:leucine carboxyl methyltransferase 1 [Lindgomyces ingoldianus]KAF2477810.1 leucine carboxyl methyltransferase 1 [Lindgomyces ingoldianus]
MSSEEIPDLRTLLTTRRGGLSRGRGRGRGPSGASLHENDALVDHAVQKTDADAAGFRLSSVQLGYLEDAYAKLFATQPAVRRPPLINRGTYVRTSAIDLLVHKFLSLSPDQPKQIVSLGAGTDTRYFRLRDRYPDLQLTYHEIDFPANTTAKLAAIQKHPQLYTKLSSKRSPDPLSLAPGATSFYSSAYNLHALDLRFLATLSDDAQPHQLPHLDPSIPTLILSEMCLVYLQPSTVSTVLSAFLHKYIPAPTPLSLVLYEPILPHDAFGRMMTSNLAHRNISLPTLAAFPLLRDQRQRLRGYGFCHGSRAADTEFIWREWVSDEEKERIAGLEMLDEQEELNMLLRHYCIAWGWRDSGSEDVFSRAWEAVREQDGG